MWILFFCLFCKNNNVGIVIIYVILKLKFILIVNLNGKIYIIIIVCIVFIRSLIGNFYFMILYEIKFKYFKLRYILYFVLIVCREGWYGRNCY